MRGYGPTVREIGNEFGIRSPNGVMCHLKALEKKGLIIREAHMARAIQLANQPISRSALASAGRLTATNPLDVLDKGEHLDFAPLFEDSENFAVTASGDWPALEVRRLSHHPTSRRLWPSTVHSRSLDRNKCPERGGA